MIATAEARELIWLAMCVPAFVVCLVSLRRSIEYHLTIVSAGLNGIRQIVTRRDIVTFSIKSVVQFLFVIIGLARSATYHDTDSYLLAQDYIMLIVECFILLGILYDRKARDRVFQYFVDQTEATAYRGHAPIEIEEESGIDEFGESYQDQTDDTALESDGSDSELRDG